MSLSDLIKARDVVERLRPFRSPVRRVTEPPKVPRRGPNPQLVGTAFDYLLRFELKRRALHAVEREWVAEQVPVLIDGPGPLPGSWITRDYLSGKDPGQYIPPEELAQRISRVCQQARQAVAEYRAVTSPTNADQRSLAEWAVRLAKIDRVFREDEFDPTYEEAPAGMVDELLALLAIVPYPQLLHSELVLLNPIFGDASHLVGGADADLIAGDLLVDFKTTASSEVRGEYLDQLFGYFLLARRAGLATINRVGIYFSRYGHLRTGETAGWIQRPDFADTERWFFERAKAEYGSPVISTSA